MKHLKKFNEDLTKSESDQSFSRELAFEELMNSIEVSGWMVKYESEIKSDIEKLFHKFDDEDLKILYYGTQLQKSEDLTEMPEDFDLNRFTEFASKMAYDIQEIFNKYLKRGYK